MLCANGGQLVHWVLLLLNMRTVHAVRAAVCREINNGGLQLVYEILMETGAQNILKALQVYSILFMVQTQGRAPSLAYATAC